MKSQEARSPADYTVITFTFITFKVETKMCHEPQTFQLNDVGFNHGLIDRRHRSRSRRLRRRSPQTNATSRVRILYYFPFTFVYFSLGSSPAALHSFHSSSLVTVDAPCLPLCFFFFFFWSRRSGEEEEKGGGGGMDGGGARRVRQ